MTSPIQIVVLDSKMHPLPPTINTHHSSLMSKLVFLNQRPIKLMFPLSYLIFINLSRIFIGKKLETNYDALMKNDTHTLVFLPSKANIVGCN